jgi:hypothetical protein
MKTYILDRIHRGQLMAQGARVEADHLEDAIEKAKKLFPDEEYQYDTFEIRPGSRSAK